MEDPHLDQEPHLYQFSNLQLMCYENYHILSPSCDCHGFFLLKPSMSVHSNQSTDFDSKLWEELEYQDEPNDTYFVSGWACSMFYRFSPVFFNREVEGICGMLIHVQPGTRYQFLTAVAKLLDMGVIPCMYLRKMSVFNLNQTVVFHSEGWFGLCSRMHSQWQKEEIKRLCDTSE